ncbi:2Fe-2S iron-sulfur cluster binding domain-containing protein, partial [Mycolicibacterium sp. CBMA 361]
MVVGRAGRTILVPQDESALEALLDAGVTVDSMCHNGLCGICQTGVLSGEVEHRDSFLTDEQHTVNEYMTLCV